MGVGVRVGEETGPEQIRALNNSQINSAVLLPAGNGGNEGEPLVSQPRIVDTSIISSNAQEEPREDVDGSEDANLCNTIRVFIH